MASIIKAEETGARKAQAVFADGAMVLTTPDGVVERWDEDAERLLGFTADEAIGQPLQRLVIPAETTDELTAKLDSMRHDGRVQHLDAVWKAKNGTAMYVSIMLSPIRGDEGETKAASIAIWDISGRKADETRLQLFRALLDKSTDAIEVIDQATLRYLDVNETACNTLGYTRDELLSMRVPDIDQDLSAEQWKRLNEELQSRQSMTIESFHRRKDGSKFPVEVNISLVQIGDLDFRIAVVRDISTRKSDMDEAKVFRTLLDKASDGIEVLDPDTLRFLDVNEAICRMHGYSREELLSMQVYDLDPYLSQTQLKSLNRALQEKGSTRLESRHHRKDGSTFPVEVSISLVRIADRVYRLAVVRDISERKQAEAEQALFRSLLDHSNDAIEVIEPGTLRFLDVNDTGCLKLGYSREEFRTMNVYDIDTMPEQEGKAIEEQIRTSGAARFESTHRRKDGSTFPVEVSVTLIELDKPYLLSITRDISERKLAETLLQESESRLRAILDGALDGIVLADIKTQRLSMANPAMCHMLDYSQEEISQLHVTDIHPEKELPYTQEQFGKQARGEIQIAPNMPVKRKDGSVFYADINTSKVQLDGNDYLVGIFRDISERKHAEEELRRTNRALKLLSQCNTLLVRSEKEQPFLEEICRLAVESGGYMMAWIGVAENDADKSVRPIAQSGYEEGYLDGAKISWANTELGQGPTGTAIRTGKTAINTDCLSNANMAPWREAILKRGYQSSIALPLIYRNRILGALTLYAAEAHAFYEEEVALLQELANEISYGIETIRTRIEHEEHGAILRHSLEQSIQAIADTVEARDPYTAGHQRNVADLAVAISREMKLPEDQIHGIRLSAIIHDLGKIHIPAEILSRPGKLTDIEYQMIRTHPQAGYDIVKGIQFPWPIADIILQHHERLDGSGYPQGLKGDQILPESMIIAVADVVEAMSSHRPYRGGLGLEAALSEIERNRGVFYDTATVDVCLKLFREQGFSLPGHSPPI